MFCRKCGKEINDDINFCPYCGESVSNTSPKEEKKETELLNHPQQEINQIPKIDQSNKSKTLEGVLLSFFLGVIGLIIGIALYPQNTLARTTFIKGWVTTFCITLVIGVIAGVFIAIYLPVGNYY